MTDATRVRTGVVADTAGRVGRTTVPVRLVVRPGLRVRSPVGLLVAQATVAALLALAASFLEARGWGVPFTLAAASVVLVVSGLLLVVWSDPDDGTEVGSGRQGANRGQTTE